MIFNSASRVSHADQVAFECARAPLHDLAEATRNLREIQSVVQNHGPHLPERVVAVMATERSRRNAHYWRYRAMFRIANQEPLFPDAENLAEASLFDLNERVEAMTGADYEYARSMAGKGISAELGHIDQLGDWNTGKLLDAQVRQLPKSERLAEAGFIFNETYDSKDEAMINYSIYVSAQGSQRVNLKGVRKRAAADLVTKEGNTFEIVKHSTFLIDNTSLTPAQHRDIEHTIAVNRLEAKRAENGKPDMDDVRRLKSLRAEIMNEAGEKIIEPFIVEPELRERSTAVIAVTSLYFALHRHQ